MNCTAVVLDISELECCDKLQGTVEALRELRICFLLSEQRSPLPAGKLGLFAGGLLTISLTENTRLLTTFLQ